MKKNKIILIGIVLIAFFLRIWNVTEVPPSLYWDEVSQGYNAYAILQTGRDEHQEFLPVARFQAFGDYKAPIYIYLTVPSLAFFGKTDFAVRFPSVFLGSLTVLTTYLLVLQLFPKYQWRVKAGLLAAFFLAISPWHIQLSRAAFEGNIATFFTVMGAVMFLYAIRKNPWFLIGSAISFILGFYAFNAHRIFIPLLVLLLSIVYGKELIAMRTQIIISIIVGFTALLPFIFFMQTPESKLRFNEVNIFTDIEVIKESNRLAEQDGTVLGRIFHNRRVLFAREYIINYFDFFHPQYLFFKGDINPRFSHQVNGQLYLWMLPLIVVGFYMLVTKHKKQAIVILGWFLLAPLAAATARETPHALRSETFIPMYEVIAAMGGIFVITAVGQYRKKSLSILFLIFSAAVLFGSIIQFLHNYLVHNPYYYSTDWQYGYKEAVVFVEERKDQYDKIYFTNIYGRPHIYVAWYGDVFPEEYWRSVDTSKDTHGFYNVYGLGKYIFTDTIPTHKDEKSLVVTVPGRVPSDAEVLHVVRFLNGKEAFIIAER